jgi:hypothetical protein
MDQKGELSMSQTKIIAFSAMSEQEYRELYGHLRLFDSFCKYTRTLKPILITFYRAKANQH